MAKASAAQNQHYVPKFILRNFLSESAKEQVNVFAKSTGKGFTTSIKNVMAERRFHDFSIGENYIASFEESVGQIERILLPAYRDVLRDRRLSGEPDQKASLATLLAFQFLRTRTQRDQFVDADRQLAEHLAKFGGSIEDIEGYEPLTDDSLKLQHIKFMQSAVGEFAQIIATKDFLLLEASKGRSFYLSDSPVNIHNSQPTDGFYGNLGLACLGIEIYMPLSSDLLLVAWCPSILEGMRKRHAESRNQMATAMLSPAMTQVRDPVLFQQQLDQLKAYRLYIEDTLSCADQGIPLATSGENMDFQNSLQVGQAKEYVICKTANFDLARRFMREYPNSKGRRVSIS